MADRSPPQHEEQRPRFTADKSPPQHAPPARGLRDFNPPGHSLKGSSKLEEHPEQPTPPANFGSNDAAASTTPAKASTGHSTPGRIHGLDGDASDQRTGSLSGRLKQFAKKVLKKATTPLLPTKVFDSSSKMPLRSSRIAAQPLSKVPVAKRGDILVMQRLGLAPAAGIAEAQQKLDAMFLGSDGGTHAEAMRELFPDGERPRRSTRQHAT